MPKADKTAEYSPLASIIMRGGFSIKFSDSYSLQFLCYVIGN